MKSLLILLLLAATAHAELRVIRGTKTSWVVQTDRVIAVEPMMIYRSKDSLFGTAAANIETYLKYPNSYIPVVCGTRIRLLPITQPSVAVGGAALIAGGDASVTVPSQDLILLDITPEEVIKQLCPIP